MLRKNGHQYLYTRCLNHLSEELVIVRLSEILSVYSRLNFITIGGNPEFVQAVVQHAVGVAQFGQLLSYFPHFIRP
jgi:hypothetical protein